MKLSFKRIMDFILDKTKIGSFSFLFLTLILLTGCGTAFFSPNGKYQYENPSSEYDTASTLGDAEEIMGDINNINGISSENNQSLADNPPAIAPGAFANINTLNPKPQPFSPPSTPHKSYNNVNISGESHTTYPANTSMSKMLEDSHKQMMNNITKELKNQK